MHNTPSFSYSTLYWFSLALIFAFMMPFSTAAAGTDPAPGTDTMPTEIIGVSETVEPPAPSGSGQKQEPGTEESAYEQEEPSKPAVHNAARVEIEGQSPALKLFWDMHRDILPWDYAYVDDIPSPVFKKPLESIEGVKPVRILDGGPGTFRWVSLEEPDEITAGSLKWYCINPGEYVEAKHLRGFWASDFQGINLKEHPLEGRYGWIVFDVYASSIPGKEEFFDGKLFPKHTLVKILETRHINGWDWHRLGPDQWVEQRRVALIKKTPRPDSIPAGDKWIDINLYEQTIAAYQGDEMVYVSLVSSGLPDFETPVGLYRIWAKVKFAKMSGGEQGKNFYYLEDVPYHMYFFNGYAIHGAYWHNNFGVKQSHGCVNVSCMDSKWFFDWTIPRAQGEKWTVDRKNRKATWVWVHD